MNGKVSAMTWWQNVEQTAAGDKPEHIACRTSSPTVGRWRTSVPRPESVASFARAYGRPVLEAFVAAGFFAAEEVRAQVAIIRIEEPSDDELLDMLVGRLRRDREDGEGNAEQPAPKPQGSSGRASLHELCPATAAEVGGAEVARYGEPAHAPDAAAAEHSQDRGRLDPA